MKKKHLYLLLGLLFLDQITKFIAHAWIQPQEKVALIYDFLYFVQAKNFGVAWGVFTSYTHWITIWNIICILILSLLYWKQQRLQSPYAFSILLMLAGILGNFLDRIIFQYVRDFIGVSIGDYQLPIFNIADLILLIGIGLLLYELLKFQPEK